jgi:hypothetical protein
VRGSCLPRWSGKGEASRTEVLSVSLSTWLKIKQCIDRGVSESLESTSTCIRSDGKITETTRNNSVPLLFSCKYLLLVGLSFITSHLCYLFTLGCKPNIAQHRLEDLYLNFSSICDFSQNRLFTSL